MVYEQEKDRARRCTNERKKERDAVRTRERKRWRTREGKYDRDSERKKVRKGDWVCEKNLVTSNEGGNVK